MNKKKGANGNLTIFANADWDPSFSDTTDGERMAVGAGSFFRDFVKNLRQFSTWRDRIQPGALIYAGVARQKVEGIEVLPFTGINELL